MKYHEPVECKRLAGVKAELSVVWMEAKHQGSAKHLPTPTSCSLQRQHTDQYPVVELLPIRQLKTRPSKEYITPELIKTHVHCVSQHPNPYYNTKNPETKFNTKKLSKGHSLVSNKPQILSVQVSRTVLMSKLGLECTSNGREV